MVKVQSTHASAAQLEAMAEHLQMGQNLIEFEVNGQVVRSFLYLFDWNIRLIVSDIDGTITKSDVLGHVLPRFGKDWTHVGITRLFANIAANGYQFMFLSSRSIAQSEETRAYLVRLKHQSFNMPAGALLCAVGPVHSCHAKPETHWQQCKAMLPARAARERESSSTRRRKSACARVS
jgi:phosphatidate phosphatase PAH1